MKKLIAALAVVAACAVKAHAVLPTDRIKLATATASGIGFTQVVPAPAAGSGLRIAVTQYEISCSTNAFGTLVAFATKDNAPADILTSTLTVSNVGLVESPYVPNGSIVAPKEQSLGINIGTALQNCAVNLLYFFIQQ